MLLIEELVSMTIEQIKQTNEYNSILRAYNKSTLSKNELINLIIIIQEESIIQNNREEEEEEEEENNCMICFESLNNGNILQLKCCKKIIHNSCLTNWENMNKYTCPHCRSKEYRLIQRKRVIQNHHPIIPQQHIINLLRYRESLAQLAQRQMIPPPIEIPDSPIPPIYRDTLARRQQRRRNRELSILQRDLFDDFNILEINLNEE